MSCELTIGGDTIASVIDHPSPASSLITLRGSLSSRKLANFAWRKWSTYASYCTPSWREPPNRGPKDCAVSTRRNDSTTFKRCMQIPPKSKAQFDCRIGRYYEPLCRFHDYSGVENRFSLRLG